MADDKTRKDDQTKPAETGEPIVDAADLSGAWGILEIKNRLNRAGWPNSARIVNIDPVIREDLILVLLASGRHVSQTDRDRRAGRLVVFKGCDCRAAGTGRLPKHPDENSHPQAEETNARHHSKAD